MPKMEFKPTRLAVKRHTKTGLRYFCKSVKEDFETYKGSGKSWQRHINEHGRKFVVNDWVSDWFYDRNEIKSFALAFSEIFDIVESPEWANEMPENGIFGGPLPKESNHFRNPIWKGKKRDPRTEEHIEAIKESTLRNNNGVWPTYERTEQHNKDMSERVKEAKKLNPAPLWTCPHCSKSGRGESNKIRWHFDNCKMRAQTC